MPTALPPTIDKDTIDDLLYFARTGSLVDFTSTLNSLSQNHNSLAPFSIIPLIIDPYWSNTLLHYASANNHTTLISTMLSYFSPSQSSESQIDGLKQFLNQKNQAGNTALHWAAINGHLDAVKMLVEAGADTKNRNWAGKEVIYDAEMNGREEVVTWLLGQRIEKDDKGDGGQAHEMEELVDGKGTEDGAETG